MGYDTGTAGIAPWPYGGGLIIDRTAGGVMDLGGMGLEESRRYNEQQDWERRTHLERENAELRHQLAELHEVMPCGHEWRFIVSTDEGTNWCALCELQGVRANNEGLLDKMTISLKEATDAREL